MTTFPENPVPCIHCGAPTILFKDGTARGHRTGKLKDDGKPEWHRQPQSAVAKVQAPAPATSAPVTGAAPPAQASPAAAAPAVEEPVYRDPTRTSIERQVAAKAAAEVVAAAIAKGMSPDEFNAWAGKLLALAARMGDVIETGEYKAPSGSLPKPEEAKP